MQSKSKALIPDQELARKKRRQQIRNWIILITVVLLIIGAVNLFNFFTRTSTVSALSLPCYAHQDVTVFQDGVLYYDGASIHFVNAGGGIEWSYPVGDGASFSVSKDHLVIWAGTQLFIVDAKGKPSYNQSMEAPIQFARIGKKYAAVVTGDDLKSTVTVKDLQGSQVDYETEAYDGMLLLDCGFYGANNEYLWTLSYDVYNPAISTIMHTYQVGQMNTGEVNLGEHLAYKVIYADNLLNVFTTQQMYIYDYKGVQNVKRHHAGLRLEVHGPCRAGTRRDPGPVGPDGPDHCIPVYHRAARVLLCVGPPLHTALRLRGRGHRYGPHLRLLGELPLRRPGQQPALLRPRHEPA